MVDVQSTRQFGTIRRVLYIVLGANLAVAVAKLIVGAMAGSVSMQADGLHSLVDASSNLVGLAGVWLAARPADANHPYGHRKYETLASIIIGALLLFTVLEIVRGAVERLLEGGAPTVSPLSLSVMVVTMAINVVVAVWEGQLGRAYGSDVLVADATQTRSDIFVSLAVLGSLGAASLGYTWVDPIVAVGVAVLVSLAAWDVLRSAAAVLSDEAVLPEQELEAVARSVPGVLATHRVWTRGHQREVYVDLDIKVDAVATVEEGHRLAHLVRDSIRRRWPTVRHIMVHVEPSVPLEATLVQRVYHLARRRRMEVHDVKVHDSRAGARGVALHLEVDPTLTLVAAHAVADELERAIREELPAITSVATHLEVAAPRIRSREEITASRPELVATVQRLVAAELGAGGCRVVRLYGGADGEQGQLDLELDCVLPAGLAVDDVHTRTERLERTLRQALPQLAAVTVHAEPRVDAPVGV